MTETNYQCLAFVGAQSCHSQLTDGRCPGPTIFHPPRSWSRKGSGPTQGAAWKRKTEVNRRTKNDASSNAKTFMRCYNECTKSPQNRLHPFLSVSHKWETQKADRIKSFPQFLCMLSHSGKLTWHNPDLSSLHRWLQEALTSPQKECWPWVSVWFICFWVILTNPKHTDIDWDWVSNGVWNSK